MNERKGQRVFNRYVDIISEILADGDKPTFSETANACKIVSKLFEDDSIIFIDAISNDAAHIKLGDELYVSKRTGDTYWIPNSDLPYPEEDGPYTVTQETKEWLRSLPPGTDYLIPPKEKGQEEEEEEKG